MKRRMLSLLLVIALAVGMLPVFAAASTAPTQDENGVYQIGTPEQLLWFAEQVNGGNIQIKGALKQDIDMSGISNWPGIGAQPEYKQDGSVTNSDKAFAGSFDGQNHTVTFQNSEWGLFRYVFGASNAVANIQNVRIAGSVRHAAVAHEAGYAHFTGCINQATITCTSGYIAGIVGKVNGQAPSGPLKTEVVITNCGNEASVTAAGGNAGGILGYSKANTRLEGCYNKGNIHGSYNVGGLAGYLQESEGTCYIQKSYNTGTVTGTSEVGGILGNMQNDVSITYCYNAGATTYAIAGARLNHTAVVMYSYFMGVKSEKSSPDYNVTLKHGETTKEIQTRATAKSAAYMASAEFASLLGSSFQQSCPTPVLTWETAKAHTGTVCEHCAFGSKEKEVYDVSFESHNGYTLSGDSRVTEGDAYTFKIAISEGYEKAVDFAVKVNGELVEAVSDGSYTVHSVSGPLSVTVVGVQVQENFCEIRLPADGYGYRAVGNKTVARETDYTFTLSFVEGFSKTDDTKVIAQTILTQEQLDKGYKPEETVLQAQGNTAPYTYVLPNVQTNYRILVSGVKVTPTATPIKVSMTISEGYNEFHALQSGVKIMDQEITVPYFDLSLYGLERYYYNPHCYVDANGKAQSQQKAGTPEIAYNNITLMHAYIVATEIFRLGYTQDRVGTGESCQGINSSRFSSENPDALISWTQGPGSSFMDFWEHGTNMNYYVNYVYPLGMPGWGSTSDQILISEGDDITLHLITGQGSGSRFGVFTANNRDRWFDQSDMRDEITLFQGEEVTLTLFWTNTTGTYETAYELMPNTQLYWSQKYVNDVPDVRNWHKTAFGDGAIAIDLEEGEAIPSTAMRTDANGKITINTGGVPEGTYYIAALGGFTEGGGVDQDGFVSTGAEAGVSYFKINVLGSNSKPGDANGDGVITSNDALQIMRRVAGMSNEVKANADADGNGVISSNDALQIMRYVAGMSNSITSPKS